MEPQNLLFILSDEHTRDISGCYGDPVVKTPNIDRLAQKGTIFTNAYTNCPICVPARASLATGRYVHQIGCWDNAFPYTGEPRGWGHRLIENGHHVTAIGKLHMRSKDDPNGHNDEIDTLHVLEGLGDLAGSIRRELRERGSIKALAREAGVGESTYSQYDSRIASEACDWLRNAASNRGDKPWVLFVGFTLPHFPLIAPPDFYNLYEPEDIPWPRLYGPEDRPTHPVLREMTRCMAYDTYFDEEKVRIARQAYYGMTSFLDHNIGRVLQALEESGLSEDTRIIYTSDHGDNLGNRGMWGKSCMYEESAAIPMIVAGNGVGAGARIDTPVSLVDAYQTTLEGAGVALTDEEEHDMPGHSLYRIARGETPDRTVLSEYHAAGSCTAMYMIRNGRWKYVHYVGHPPQLFDIEADPYEANDLGQSAAHRDIIAECEAKLRAVVDPEEANERAFRDQDALIQSFGGVDAVLNRGDFCHTPAPGEKPVFA